MIVTFAALAAGADAAPDGPEALLAHPVNAVVTMSAPATGARYLYFTEGLRRLCTCGREMREVRAGTPLRAAGAGPGCRRGGRVGARCHSTAAPPWYWGGRQRS